MATLFNFEPATTAPFQFNPTLDGQVCSARVPWSLFGQRYYLELSALDGTVIFNKALVGSPIGVAIQSATWYNGHVHMKTEGPHGYHVGLTLDLTISGCVPDTFNGLKRCLAVAADEFIFDAQAFPGIPIQLGRVDYNINLVWGYFGQSTLVFREPSRQFEVSS